MRARARPFSSMRRHTPQPSPESRVRDLLASDPFHQPSFLTILRGVANIFGVLLAPLYDGVTSFPRGLEERPRVTGVVYFGNSGDPPWCAGLVTSQRKRPTCTAPSPIAGRNPNKSKKTAIKTNM